MAVTSLYGRLVRTAPVPVVVARGVGWGPGVARLHASPDVRVVASPRDAVVVVVAGAVPRSRAPALRVLHDQVPPPRGIAAVDVDGDLAALGLGQIPVLPDDDVVGSLGALVAGVLGGERTSPAQGRADNPVEWQGVGPHGQGGEGMMGGTPYGRMMPMPPTEGRDGLALDRLSLTLGPFLPGLPAGLMVEVGLQGDVLEEVQLSTVAAHEALIGVPATDGRPAAVREAARHLQAIADLAALAGLDALARRAARLALDPTPDGIAAVRRRLDRRWALRAATDGIGVLDGTDVTARWRGWFDTATDTLASVPQPPDATGPTLDLDDLAGQLTGMEIGQAWLTLCSLQLRRLEGTVPAGPVGTA